MGAPSFSHAEANMGDATKTQSHEAADDEALLCPFCGYDLRGNPSERCSECGQVIDRELARCAIPWVHRRYIGRVRGYVKTVWRLTNDTPSLRQEVNRRQSLHDARQFRGVTAALIGMGLLGVLASIAPRGMQMLESFPAPLRNPHARSPWTHDLYVPWAAGASRWFIWPVLGLGLAYYLSTAPARLFYPKYKQMGESARAISHYAASAMVWCAPILLLQLALLAMEGNFFLRWGLGVSVGMIIMMVLLVGLISARIIQWSARVRGPTVANVLLAIPYLWTWWLWGLFVWLGIVPWCVGWVWIVVDSFLK